MKITRKEAHKEIEFPALAKYKGCGSICLIYKRCAVEFESITLHDGSKELWESGQDLSSEFEFLPAESIVELKQEAKKTPS